MSKALYLSEISGRFIKYEDIPATSHTPQLLASSCFLSEKRDSKVGFEFSKVFLQFEEIGFFGWPQRSESMWIILGSLILTMNSFANQTTWTPSQRGIQITFFFSGGFNYFSKMGGQHHQLGISTTWFLLNLNVVWTVNDKRWMYLLVCF